MKIKKENNIPAMRKNKINSAVQSCNRLNPLCPNCLLPVLCFCLCDSIILEPTSSFSSDVWHFEPSVSLFKTQSTPTLHRQQAHH